MKLSSLSALTDSTYETDNFTTVYNNSNAQSLQGVTILNFLQPFYWDGTSNIILDISYNTNFSNNPYTISSDDLGIILVLFKLTMDI